MDVIKLVQRYDGEVDSKSNVTQRKNWIYQWHWLDLMYFSTNEWIVWGKWRNMMFDVSWINCLWPVPNLQKSQVIFCHFHIHFCFCAKSAKESDGFFHFHFCFCAKSEKESDYFLSFSFFCANLPNGQMIFCHFLICFCAKDSDENNRGNFPSELSCGSAPYHTISYHTIPFHTHF